MKRLWPFAFGRRKDELQEEIDHHLRMAIADRVARGEPEEVARRETLREFGNVPLIQDVTRRMWGFAWLEHLAQDLGYAWRQMHRAPMFAFTVIGTLALGIAAGAAMFTVVDHVLLQPLPYRHPDRIVAILEGAGKEGRGSSLAPWLDIQEWRNRSHSFQQIAFWGHLGARNYLEQKTSALPIDALRVSSNLFPTLEVKSLSRTRISACTYQYRFRREFRNRHPELSAVAESLRQRPRYFRTRGRHQQHAVYSDRGDATRILLSARRR